ncbi:MAG TPA: ribonuclease E inhibitor RraB [Bryobacteraceae bacterium]|nr:ribonuclease E inhibitor RraB [Bryobacteraceae bacterium]
MAKELRGHKERNRKLRVTFAQRNVDLNEPRPIEFHFWAWTQRDAAALGRSLYQMGFLVRLLAPAPIDADPDRWAIESGAKIPLTQALGDELAEKLVKLAAGENAVFDGWGTSI